MKLKYSNLIKLLIWIHFIMWILVIPITELQLFFFGKKVITLFALGIVEFVIFLIFIIILLSKKTISLNPVCKICFNYILVMMGLWLIGFIINESTPIYWKFYYIFYWIMPVLIIIVASQVKFDFKSVLKLLTIIAFINAILVLIQHFGNTLIWPFEVDDQGNELFFISSAYYNTKQMIRCPGLCMSGLDSGALMIFGMMYVIGENKLKICKRIFLISFLLFATWFTGTRNIYLFLVFIIGCILINYFLNNKYKLKKQITVIYTIFSFLACMCLQFNLGTTTQNATQDLLTDFTSMNIRLSTWNSVIADFSSSNLLQQLFGQSIWQSAGYPLVVDNMYLELLIMVGIFGTLYFCFFIFKMSFVALKTGDKSIIPYFSYFLGVFIYGTLNVIGSLNLTFLMIFGILISQSVGSERNENKYRS